MTLPEPPSKKVLAAGFVVYLALSVILISQHVEWDGLALLSRAKDPAPTDLMHVFYPYALGAAMRLGALVGVSPETCGGLLSAISASLVFVCFWRLLEGEGVARVPAVLITLLVLTTFDLWREAASVEVYLPSLAALSAAALGARAFTRNERTTHLVMSVAAWLLAIGFHGCAVLAAPWLIVLSELHRRRLNLAQLSALAVPIAAVIGFLLTKGLGRNEIQSYARHARAFLPWWQSDSGALAILGFNAERLWSFHIENFPWLTAATALSVVTMVWRRHGLAWHATALAVPFLMAFVVLGVPVYGLLFPCLLAFGLMTAAAHRVWATGRRPKIIATVILAALLAGQIAMTMPERWREARTPDPVRKGAEALEDALPAGSTVLAGKYGQHFRFYTSLHVVLLPELLHDESVSAGSSSDPLSTVTASAHATVERPVFITSEGLAELLKRGVRIEELVDLVGTNPPFLVHSAPPIWIFRIPPR